LGPVPLHPTEQIQVPLVPLDDEGLPPIGFIKVDVEAHELPLLAGARLLLQRDRPTMLIEVDHRYHPERPVADCLAEIEGLGYRGQFFYRGSWFSTSEFRLDQHQLDLGTSTCMHDHANYVNNFLFRADA
jgi:hypothetical protein